MLLKKNRKKNTFFCSGEAKATVLLATVTKVETFSKNVKCIFTKTNMLMQTYGFLCSQNYCESHAVLENEATSSDQSK